MNPRAFIETQFPVSRISKESYKERMANASQTLTGLGKWWGRKPLILVRAAILGCLMPASDDPRRDTEIFLKLLGMDARGLDQRRIRRIAVARLHDLVSGTSRLHKYLEHFDLSSAKPRLKRGAPRDEIEQAAFHVMGYDEQLTYCLRPEQVQLTDARSWAEINAHLGTSATSLSELAEQLSQRRFGHRLRVGDCFCGGGSIPFEASRIGCEAYGSDLNPIAGLLSWAAIHIRGGTQEQTAALSAFLKQIYADADRQITALGLEHNEAGDRALAYLYCIEVRCPECGRRVPLLPTRVIGKGSKTIVELHEDGEGYAFDVVMGVSAERLKAAGQGTVTSRAGLICPHCGRSTPMSALRHDVRDTSGITHNQLRLWEAGDVEPREDDVFTERLYAVKHERPDGSRYYAAPGSRELDNEQRIRQLVAERLPQWQASGLLRPLLIEAGDKTRELLRNRGWQYWHQLFNPRQLLTLMLLKEGIAEQAQTQAEYAVGLLGLNRCLNFNSRLCRWLNTAVDEHGKGTFYNQAFNTLFNYSCRSLPDLRVVFCVALASEEMPDSATAVIDLCDAHEVQAECDLWLTDPPYADAICYHELSEFFLAWDRDLLLRAFPNWYADSKRVLAVRGDERFARTMIEIYTHLAEHMSEDGMQVVMFTHSDPGVWAQLALIMWQAGLRVSAAWNIATETDSAGLKSGNYVKGTVLLVMRRRTGEETAFLDEISADIRTEVQRQITYMQDLDDGEEPNFSDPDYVLAAYAASLKVLTSYAAIEDLDLAYELDEAIAHPRHSKVVGIIENARKIAYDCVIPAAFPRYVWQKFSNAEKFYFKGLESEKQGNCRIGVYQEFARGFALSGYGQLMASERANAARLKTPVEMAGRILNEVPDFQHALTRVILQGLYVGVKADLDPGQALNFIKAELADYWDKREMIGMILTFLGDTGEISNMRLHWEQSARMAKMLQAAVAHDGV